MRFGKCMGPYGAHRGSYLEDSLTQSVFMNYIFPKYVLTSLKSWEKHVELTLKYPLCLYKLYEKRIFSYERKHYFAPIC